MQKNSKFLNIYIFYLFCLITASYYPIFFFEFIPQDQLRIFKYDFSLSKSEKFFKCIDTTMGWMFLTGRPLVWITECVEHFFIDKISHISLFRIPNLILSLYIIHYGARLLEEKCGKDYLDGIILFVPLIFIPGFMFMFLQGLTSFGVIFSILMSLISFRLMLDYKCKKTDKFKIFLSFLFFLVGLLNYPIFAFIIFSIIFIFFSLNDELSFKKKITSIFYSSVFYLFISFFYFLCVKLFNLFFSEYDLGQYKFGINYNSIFQNILLFYKNIFQDIIFLNIHIKTFYIYFPLIFLFIYFFNLKEKKILKRIIENFTLFIISNFVVIISIFPSILSHFNSLPTRHIISIHFLTSFFLIYFLLQLFEKKILVIFLCLVGFNQVNISLSLLNENQIEINKIEQFLIKNVNEDKISKGISIYVVKSRSTLFSNKTPLFNSGEFSPASKQNSSHIKELFSLVLKKNYNIFFLKNKSIKNCKSFKECEKVEKNKISLFQLYIDEVDSKKLSDKTVLNLY